MIEVYQGDRQLELGGSAVHCVLEGHGSVLRLAQKAAAEPNNQQYN